MIKLYGYESALQPRTFDSYNDVDCFNYSGLHDYIKFLKWGYGKATDHACREIRLKRLTREEGISLVKKYQFLAPGKKQVSLFLDWLGMKEKEFWRYIDLKRDARIWKKGKEWELLDSVINHKHDNGVNHMRLNKKEACEFTIHKKEGVAEKEDGYVLIGRGWVDTY